jgi:hypothetical protein
MINLNTLRNGALAGLLAGALIGGIGARLAMRVVALVVGSQPSLTVSGTMLILLMGAILGIPLGLLYVALRRVWRWADGWLGLLLGVALLLLLVVPLFTSQPGGEFGLLSPLAGIALFGVLPVGFGLALAWLVPFLERRFAGSPARQASVVWIALFGLAALLALISMSSLLGERVVLPPAMVTLYTESGIRAETAYGVLSLIMLAFTLTYLGLAALIFWQNGPGGLPQFAAVVLLLFAGAFFHQGPLLPGMMGGAAFLRLIPPLLQVAGLAGLFVLLWILPDGRFAPRVMWVATAVWVVWLILWFVNPWPGGTLDPRAWPDPLLWVIVVGALGLAVGAQAVRARQAPVGQRRRGTVTACALVVLAFGLLWALMLLFPAFRIRHAAAPAILFGFVLYLLPWLGLAVTVVVTLRAPRARVATASSPAPRPVEQVG